MHQSLPAKQNCIEISLEGIGDNNGVALSIFNQTLHKFNNLLNKIEHRLSAGKHAAEFVVIDLSHSSPAKVTIEVRSLPDTPIINDLIINNINDILNFVNGSDTSVIIQPDELEIMKDLCLPLGKKIGNISIGMSNNHYQMTSLPATKIQQNTTPVEVSYATIEGELEKLDLHNHKNVFFIFSPFGFKKLKCRFPDSLESLVTSSIKRKVSVSGLAKYRPNSYFPYEIAVERLEIFPADSELPSFENIKGMLPNITNGLSPAAYVRKERDSWDE